jgi:hypothetical protein
VPEVDELYDLPLEEFISARGALAKALRAEGRRDEAKEVSSLRKPSVPAWAVNQLVRTQKRQVRELFKAGDDLRAAQSELLEGRGNAARLRDAGEAERSAVEELLQAARSLPSGGGGELSQTALDRISDTLHAAALDQEARPQVEEGRLERELRHVGLGSEGLLSGPFTPSSGTRSSKPPATRAEKRRSTRSAKGRAKMDAHRKSARQEAERATEAARAAAEDAERAAASARKRRDEAVAALDEAEADVREANERVGQSTKQLRQAERALQRIPRV